jgi:hypothetical protein
MGLGYNIALYKKVMELKFSNSYAAVSKQHPSCRGKNTKFERKELSFYFIG